MTVLLQTRVPRELAVRFKSTAQAQGKSTYRALRELAEQYAAQGRRREFASNQYSDRFSLPPPARFKEELKARMRRRHETHH